LSHDRGGEIAHDLDFSGSPRARLTIIDAECADGVAVREGERNAEIGADAIFERGTAVMDDRVLSRILNDKWLMRANYMLTERAVQRRRTLRIILSILALDELVIRVHEGNR